MTGPMNAAERAVWTATNGRPEQYYPGPDEYDQPALDGPEPRTSSWQPVDLTDVLAGRYRPPQPTVGARNDGVGLFYPGRVHSVASESEGGKTWFALTASASELNDGRHVVYLDFEDDEGGVVGRLMAMGVDTTTIGKQFHYLRPDESIRVSTNRDHLVQVLTDTTPSLAILDGVTEAMTLHGLELKDNTDIAAFGTLLPRSIARRGPAVVCLDHVTKSAENRGRYAIGGQHKLAGLNGAAYVLENRAPFGVGIAGRSGIYLAKDRPAQLRRHALPSGESGFWFGDLSITSQPDGSVMPDLWPPREGTGLGFRPTKVMKKVARVLAANPGGLSKTAVETMAGGRAAVVRTGLELLIAEGYVQVTKGPNRTQLHTLLKPFGDDDDSPA